MYSVIIIINDKQETRLRKRQHVFVPHKPYIVKNDSLSYVFVSVTMDLTSANLKQLAPKLLFSVKYHKMTTIRLFRVTSFGTGRMQLLLVNNKTAK